jgi:RimJ/RimL family protein N-acetyltransferase
MLVYNQPEAVNYWIRDHGGGYAAPGSFAALGWVEDYKLVGGITFSHFNKKHCLVNVALAGGKFPVGLLRAGLFYSFHQLALRRLTFLIAEDNLKSQTLARKLGATLEATLRDADPSGDLLIFSLFPEDCKLWSRFDEKRRRAAIPRSELDDPVTRGRESEDVQLPTRSDADKRYWPNGKSNVEPRPSV